MVESQHVDDDNVMYGDDSAGGHVFLHDADMLDQPDLFYGGQGMQTLELVILSV